MIRKRNLLLTGSAAAMLQGCFAPEPPEPPPPPPPPPAMPQPQAPPPAGYYVVINNTSDTLNCAMKWPGGAWSGWFTLSPGANWQQATTGGTISFQCQPPVRQLQYTLHGGKLYNLLRTPDGGIELAELTT